MENKPDCFIKEIQGHYSRHRGLVFVHMPDETRVNAAVAFDELYDKDKRNLRTRFDHWLGGGVHKKYFHGWDKSEYQGRYVNCFVFKLTVKRSETRFYGYLCHPNLKAPRFEVCLLILHTCKDQWETKEADLKFVKEIGEDPRVKKALADLCSLQ